MFVPRFQKLIDTQYSVISMVSMHKALLWIVHEAIDRNKVFHSLLYFHTWFPVANAILEAMEPFEGGAPLKE